MAATVGHSHSFDIYLADQYGIEEAIFINYFQHWIRKNKSLQRNQHEGRTWMFETQEEMAENFPYMNRLKVLRVIKKLVKKGVLMKGKFNKIKYDNTNWYAFVEEEKFIPFPGNVQKRTSTSSKVNTQKFENAPPIPVTNTVTNTYTEKEVYKEKASDIGGEPPDPPSASPPHSPSARVLFDLFLEKIKERNPEFKDPNTSKWLKDFDLLLRVDKRDLERTKQLILWASTHKWWSIACLSPGKLKKCYDEMLMQMQSQGAQNAEEALIKANREHVAGAQKRFPEKLRGLKVYQKYITREGTGKDVSFNLPQETFRAAFLGLFGGRDA